MSISPLQKWPVHGPLQGPTPERAQARPHSVTAIPQLRQTGAQIAFSGSPVTNPVKARKLLEHLDFTAVGASPVKQIAVIFSSLITWRLLAANERRRASVSKRWNELRENLFRDLLGFGFWFLGVPVLQRVYLAQVSKHNPQLKDVLIRHEKASVEDSTQASKNLLGWLKSNNPLSNRYIPSSQQVKDQMQQALSSLKRAGLSPSDSVYQEAQAGFQNLIKHRNIATAIGLGSTILLLGVGINLLNFWLTRRNVSQAIPPQMPAMPMAAQSAPHPTTGTPPVASPPVMPVNQSVWPYPGLAQTSPYRMPLPTNPFACPFLVTGLKFHAE